MRKRNFLPVVATALFFVTMGVDVRANDDVQIITDIAAWHHPAKQVLKKYKLDLVEVDLRDHRRYPVFHVVSWPYDPTSSATGDFFTPLLYDLLQANGGWPYKIVADDEKTGFEVRKKKMPGSQTAGMEIIMTDDKTP